MSRDSTGNYTSPSGQFVAGTTILANVMNSKLNDIGSEITNSLDRNGKGGMLSYLRGIDGTINLPAYSFTSEITIGLRRAGTGDVRMSKDGTDLQKWSTTEVRVYPAAFFAGGLTVDAGGATITAGGLTVTAGGATVEAGGATVEAGGLSARAALQASGTVGATNKLIAGTVVTDEMAATSGLNYPLAEVQGFTHNANQIRFAIRAYNRDTVTDWEQVGLRISYDVDAVLGAGGYFEIGKTGAKVESGTAATSGDAAAALELTNGNLKLSGIAPASTVAVTNTLTPANLVKAWAHLTTTGGSSTAVTVTSGFNVTSAVASGVVIDVTLAAAVSTGGIVIVQQMVSGGPPSILCAGIMSSTTTLAIRARDLDDATLPVSDPFSFQAGSAKSLSVLVLSP